MDDSPAPITVLHVDDEPQFGELVAKFLERADEHFQVETALSAADGLEQLDSDVDCVVSDQDMPGRTGIEFLETVREHHPSLPFILFTGKGSEEIASEAISAGVTDYLQKEGGTEQYKLLANKIRNAVEKYRARNAVRETEQWAARLLEHSSDYLLVVDDTGTVTYASPSIKRVMGYDPDDIIGTSAYDHCHPDDLARATDAFTEVLEHPDREVTVNFRAQHADGHYRWLEVRGGNLLEDPVVEGVLVNARDITETTEQNRAFEAFIDIVNDKNRSFDQQMRDVLDLGREFLGLDNGIISRIEPPEYHVEHVATSDDSIDPGTTFDISETFCELVFEADEAVSFRSPAVGGVEKHPCYQKLGLAAYLGEPLLVDGERFGTLNFSSPSTRDEPFSDGETAFIRTLAEWVGKELSRRRQLEQVRSQQAELERQNDRLEQFISFVSHDLRTPLNVAHGRIELAMAEGDRDGLGNALEALERSQRLIDDLLELAHDRSGSLTVEGTGLATRATRSWESLDTGGATIDIRTEAAISADSDRLQQLLENMFQNAIEHGGEAVSVTVGDLDAGFYVADDGPGIPPADRDRVFDMGYSTDSDGTGFGLCIVKEIADSHGWELRLCEADGGGARFEFTGVEAP